jgi:hypothetical protein
MRDERPAGLFVGGPRDEQQQRRGPHAPDLVPIDEQIEEERPLLRVPPRVEDAPGVGVARRWRPPRRLEEHEEIGLVDRLARHRARRPPVHEQVVDWMVRPADLTTFDDHGDQ